MTALMPREKVHNRGIGLENKREKKSAQVWEGGEGLPGRTV